ncbi:MAG: hypothetical protein ACK5LJ_03030 [Paracoccus sp. (in: a-proteobacteria)]
MEKLDKPPPQKRADHRAQVDRQAIADVGARCFWDCRLLCPRERQESADQSWGKGLVDAAIFAAIGSLGVVLPWLIGGEKMNPMLERMRDWLYQHNNIIMAVLFGFLGVNALGGAVAMLVRW